VAKELDKEPPWLVAAAAVVVAFALDWLGHIVLALGEPSGVPVSVRMTDFFSPGSIEWGLGVILGLALLAIGRLRRPDPGSSGGLAHMVHIGLLAASGVVALSGLIDGLTVLTNFTPGADYVFSQLFSYIGAIVLGAAASLWALASLGWLGRDR
jgi:hypothetical protein